MLYQNENSCEKYVESAEGKILKVQCISSFMMEIVQNIINQYSCAYRTPNPKQWYKYLYVCYDAYFTNPKYQYFLINYASR